MARPRKDLTEQQIRYYLLAKKHGLNNNQISKMVGIPYSTLCKKVFEQIELLTIAKEAEYTAEDMPTIEPIQEEEVKPQLMPMPKKDSKTDIAFQLLKVMEEQGFGLFDMGFSRENRVVRIGVK